MTSDDFRRLALELPEAVESAHMEHPDFRAGGRIFATLASPAEGWAMVKLPPDEQAAVVAAYPATFVPAKGAWGRQGSTNVRLADADERVVKQALSGAYAFATVARKTKTKRRA